MPRSPASQAVAIAARSPPPGALNGTWRRPGRATRPTARVRQRRREKVLDRRKTIACRSGKTFQKRQLGVHQTQVGGKLGHGRGGGGPDGECGIIAKFGSGAYLASAISYQVQQNAKLRQGNGAMHSGELALTGTTLKGHPPVRGAGPARHRGAGGQLPAVWRRATWSVCG